MKNKNEEENEEENDGWEGSERREAKRRYITDRRTFERRKKYLSSILIPTIIGLLGAGILSWGAYVTHTTYGISAKYEETFTTHIDNQVVRDTVNDYKFESMQKDYNTKIIQLNDDMNDGFKELRETQQNIYSILFQFGVKKNEEIH
jgi:hypothetical protein